MELQLTPIHATYLQQMLVRVIPKLRDTGPMAPMVAFLRDMQQRLLRGEREFSLDDKQTRYLRRTIRGVRKAMEEQAAGPGGGMMQSQLQLSKPVFELILND